MNLDGSLPYHYTNVGKNLQLYNDTQMAFSVVFRKKLPTLDILDYRNIYLKQILN